MNIKSRLVGIALPMLAAGFMPLVHAADPGSGVTADNGALEEVIVTAEKRPERLQDVPVTVTVVSAAQLEDQHVTTLADLARTTPALEMIQSFGGPGGGGQVRGVGTQSFTRSAEGSVGVVVDGVSQGNVNISNIFDVKQVEVLEGPQGTLFGLTSSAGVINITTNAPDPTHFESTWHADGAQKGAANSEFGQETIHGVVNIPLSSDSALRIAGSLDDYRGVQHNSFTGQDDVADNYGLRAHYLLDASGGFRLSIVADYQREIGPQSGGLASFNYVSADPALTAELAACGITPGWGNQDRCANHLQAQFDSNYGLSVQMDWDLGNNTLTSISAYRRDVNGPDAQDVQGEPLESPQIFSNGGLGASRLFSEELRIASHSGGAIDYTAGLFYSNYLTLAYSAAGASFNIEPVATPYFPPGPPGSGPPPGTVLLNIGGPSTALTQTTSDAAAVFGQMTYHLTDKLSFIGGLRYQYQLITDYDSPNGYSPDNYSVANATATGTSMNQSNVSGKVGVQYKITPVWTSYATVTRGYKGFQAQAATTTTPAVLIPAEIPLAYEIGLKGETLEHRIGVDFDVFYEHVQNYQGQSCYLNGEGVLVCLPNSFNLNTRGVELNLYGHPLPQWSINGGFIYDIAQYPACYEGENPENLTTPTTPSPACTPAANQLSMAGLQLVGVPKEKLTLSTDYTIPMGAVTGFLGSDAVFRSQTRLGYSPDPRFAYPEHWEVGLRAGVRSTDGRWGLTAWARDINNAHEPLSLFGGPAFSGPPPPPPPASPIPNLLFFNPNYPNGQISGVSGWIGPQSLREVGLSFDLKF
jgi:iron complex outermembrane receptor protein